MIKCKILRPGGCIPTISPGSAGHDLYAAEDFFLQLGQVAKVPTAVAIEIPEGHFGLIRDRSSMGGKGIAVLGGVVDADYRGEIFVCLARIAFPFPLQEDSEKVNYQFRAGDRIAQMIILPTPHVEQIMLEEELSVTCRGENGFGSSGR